MDDERSLAEDMERIAKLRGLSRRDVDTLIRDAAPTYQESQRRMNALRARSVEDLKHQWSQGEADKRRDLVNHYDRLPPLSRHFLRSATYELSSSLWGDALMAFGNDEAALCEAVSKSQRIPWPVPVPDPPRRRKMRPWRHWSAAGRGAEIHAVG